MAGYKQVLFQLEPIALYSFDGEQVKNDKRFYQRPEINDDTGNSHGRLGLETLDEQMPCYHTSNALAPLDRYEQRAIRFCPNGPQLNAEAAGLSRWPKAYAIMPNCLAWDFSQNEFTYVFLAKRGNQTQYDVEDKHYGRSVYMDVLFEHVGVVSMGIYHGYLQPASWWIHVPAAGDIIHVTGELINPGLGEAATMIVVRYKNNRLEVIKNLETVLDRTFAIDESSFSLDRGSKQLTIGGCDVPKSSRHRTSDRITVPTDIDQFAIYNKYISDTDIGRLYRRIWKYSDMITVNRPSDFYEFSEQSLALDKRIVNYTNRTSLYVWQGADKAQARMQGPMPTSRGIRFTGTEVRTNYTQAENYLLLPMSRSSEFTFMFAFKLEHSNRGVLFTQTSETPTYEGITIWANSLNRQHNQGNVEITFDNVTAPITIATNLSSDWHSLTIRKDGDFIDAWLDGRQVLYHQEYRFRDAPNRIGSSFFGSHLNINPIDGSLANVIVYPHAMAARKIRAFHDYESIYKIRGSASLNGNPARLDVRAYHHDSGELIAFTQSNVDTGVWIIHLLDNSAIDVLILDHDDPSVKLKCFGPVIPSEVNDQPYLIP